MKKLIFLLSLPLILISCQGSEDPVGINAGSTTMESHVGTWNTGCITASDNSTKIIHNLVISENPKTVSLTVKIYPLNSDCSSGQIAEFDSSASYVRSGNSYTTTLTSYGYTPKNADILVGLNPIPGIKAGFCGLEGWQLNQRKEILGLTCVLQTEDYSRQNNESNEFNVSRNGSVLETDEYPTYDYIELIY